MSIALEDQRNIVTVHDGETITVQSYSPGTIAAGLQLNAALSGSVLRRVRDNAGTNTPLHLAEDSVVVDGAALVVDSVQFDLTAGVDPAPGELAWNAADKTLNLGIGNPTLQIGQESFIRVHNDTASQINDGEVCTISGVIGGRIGAVRSDATVRNLARGTVGIATEDIGIGQEGMITTRGLVRGLNTNAWAPGSSLFLHASIPGGLQTAPPPFPPLSAVFIGMVVVQHIDEGVIYVQIGAPPALTELVDVSVSGPATNELLVYNAITSVFENKIPSVTIPGTLSAHIDKPARGQEMAMWGGLDSVVSGVSLDSGSPINTAVGCGKVLLCPHAGSDAAGTITITGDTRDRNTGEITLGDVEVLTIAGLSTDTSDVDANGNTRHAIVGAYLTAKWFQGSIAITTAAGGAGGVILSDVDIYLCAFYQFGDLLTQVLIDGMDITAYASSAAAWIDAHFYSVEVAAGRAAITRMGSADFTTAQTTAQQKHRGKISGVAKTLVPATDGIFLDVFPGPFNQTYWENISIVLRGSTTQPLELS